MRDERLQAALDGYSKFLQDKDLALPKHQPYLVRWVRGFLLLGRERASYTFEQTLDLFLAEVGGRMGVKPWQIQRQGGGGRAPQQHSPRGSTGALRRHKRLKGHGAFGASIDPLRAFLTAQAGVCDQTRAYNCVQTSARTART